MANLTQVTLAGGVPTNSGTVSTVDALMADGGQATLGAKADAASTASDVTPISAISIWKQISKSAQAIAASIAGSLTVANAGTFAVQAAVAPGASETKVTAATIGTGGVGYLGWLSTIAQSLAGTLTVASHAVTNAGTFAVQATIAAGTALIGIVKIGDGTNTATVGVYGTAPGAVNALNVNASITNANGNGSALQANAAPVTQAPTSFRVAVTPVVTAGAYTAGFVLGGIITFANALLGTPNGSPTKWSAVLESISVKFKATAATGEVDVAIFTTSPAGTYGDHGAPTFNTGDAAKLVGIYSLPTPLSTLGTMACYNLDGIGAVIDGASTSLFAVVTVKGTPTPASTTDVIVEIGVLQG